MARKKDYQLSQEEQQDLLQSFFVCISCLRGYKDVADFLKDLLNKEEMFMLARRLKAAQLLEQGMTFDEVSMKLGMGNTTIAKVNFWLRYGRGGYLNAVLKLDTIARRQESKRIRKAKLDQPFSFDWVKRKYGRITMDDLVDLKDEVEESIRHFRKRRKQKRNNDAFLH